MINNRLFLVLLIAAGCKTPSAEVLSKNAPKENTIILESGDNSSYANSITAEELKKNLYEFASDDMQGRETGEPGQKKAAEYLKLKYAELGIPSPDGIDYLQKIPEAYFNGSAKSSENVIAYLKGTTYPEELIVISAHYDHLGVNNTGEIFNGADDDGSGTVAILQIAKAFKKAKDEGNGPKRSMLFLHVTGEEKGLYGSKYYTENPLFPLEKTVVDLNIDMIGRVDDNHIDNPNYIYIIGSDRLSYELHNINEAINKKHNLLTLDYTYNDEKDPNRFYYRSDHYNFAKQNIPIIFYFNGVHDDYHKITDTPDKIEYTLLAKRSQLVFYTAWELANKKQRVLLINR